MTIVSGEYTSTYNAKALGHTQDGWRMEMQGGRKAVTVDKFGDTEIDGVYRGVNTFFECILKNWNQYNTGSPPVTTGFKDLFWPYGAVYGALGTIGRLEVYSDMTKALVLTALANTPAATIGPWTVTASEAILEAEFARTVNFNSEDRSVPVRLRSYPFNQEIDQDTYQMVFLFT